VRDAAVAIGSVLGLLYLFPILTQVVGSPGVARHLQQIGPMTAGLEIQASTGLRSLPLGPMGGPRRTRRLGRRGAPGRHAGAAHQGRVRPGPRNA